MSAVAGNQVSAYNAEHYFKNGRFGCYCTVLGENNLIPDDYLYGYVPAFRQFIIDADPGSKIVRIFIRVDY